MSILVKKYKPASWASHQSSSDKFGDLRAKMVLVFFVCFGLIIAVKLARMQLFEHDYYLALANDQHEIFRQLYPNRGTIFIKDNPNSSLDNKQSYYPVALNKELNMLYAVPKSIGDPEAVLEALKETFSMAEYKTEDLNVLQSEVQALQRDIDYTKQFIGKDPANEAKNIAFLTRSEPLLKLKNSAYEKAKKDQSLLDAWRQQLNKKDDPYEPLKHFVSDEDKEKIKSFNLEGVDFAPETTRYYPEKEIGAQLIGFVGKQADDNIMKGSYGLEGCYNKELAGESGFLHSEKDISGRWIALAGKELRNAKDGDSFYLTIDKTIQYYACSELEKALILTGAVSGSIVIMDPMTGAIIALCNAPEFDPNKYNEVKDLSVFKNSVVQDGYEPGSVFKPITLAAAIDAGKVDPFSGYEDTGEVRIGSFTIMNSDKKAHGWRTMTQVLEESLNTGTAFVARQVGREVFLNYLRSFGFGANTNVDLCHESAGDLSSLEIDNKKNDIYLVTASFGQGIMTTPLQLAKAYSAIANGGNLLEPYVVEAIYNSTGEEVMKRSPKVIGQAISAKTAKEVGGMLVSVVKNGHAKSAAIPGYLIAAKTGTAQVAEKGGYGAETIHTFAGFGPFENPRFAMIVKLDKVKNSQYAEGSALPLWRKIAKFMIEYYGIPPEVR